jgi:hypothetical protein
MLLGQLGMPGRHLLGNLARLLDQVGVHLWMLPGTKDALKVAN